MARCWPWGGAAAGPAPRCAGPPGNGTSAGAGSRGASPAGPTCTTSCTGSTAAAPTWRTSSACAPRHHKLIHDRGYQIATRPDGGFTFYRPGGTALPGSPPLPPPDGAIGGTHDADITPETIIPPWYGERLDLDHAIYICLANARNQQERQEQRDQAGQPADRGRVRVYEPEDWPDRIRRYYDEHPAGPPRPVLIPIEVG